MYSTCHATSIYREAPGCKALYKKCFWTIRAGLETRKERERIYTIPKWGSPVSQNENARGVLCAKRLYMSIRYINNFFGIMGCFEGCCESGRRHECHPHTSDSSDGEALVEECTRLSCVKGMAHPQYRRPEGHGWHMPRCAILCALWIRGTTAMHPALFLRSKRGKD